MLAVGSKQIRWQVRWLMVNAPEKFSYSHSHSCKIRLCVPYENCCPSAHSCDHGCMQPPIINN